MKKRIIIFTVIAVCTIAVGLGATLFLPNAPKAPTAPNQAIVKRVVAVGDIACSPGEQRTAQTCQDKATAELTKKQNPDAVLLLGDFTLRQPSILPVKKLSTLSTACLC